METEESYNTIHKTTCFTPWKIQITYYIQIHTNCPKQFHCLYN